MSVRIGYITLISAIIGLFAGEGVSGTGPGKALCEAGKGWSFWGFEAEKGAFGLILAHKGRGFTALAWLFLSVFAARIG